MSDLRIDDVVEVQRMIGVEGKYVIVICKTCSHQHQVTKSEFHVEPDNYIPHEVDQDILEYVGIMRAWNCCHADEEPIDGFPEEPDVFGVEFSE